MGTLDSGLRRTLERVVEAARTAAEDAAWAALQRLAVTRAESFPHMSSEDRALREWPRMKARELGASALESRSDVRDLVEACAYEQWHRMLFARFLAENDLLIHPDYGVPLTLAQCAQLAGAEGELDGWMLAAKYAARMLPRHLPRHRSAALSPLRAGRHRAAGRVARHRAGRRLPRRGQPRLGVSILAGEAEPGDQ